jgi:hypothetical protein
MLSGWRAFEGENVSDLLVALLSRMSIWAPCRHPRRCGPRFCATALTRDPQRLRDVGDARRVLERIIAGAPDDTVAPPTLVRRSTLRGPRHGSPGSPSPRRSSSRWLFRRCGICAGDAA